MKASFQTSRILVIFGMLLGALGPGTSAMAQDAPETTGETTIWLPTNVFTQTEIIDTFFNIVLWLTMVVGIGVFALMGYFLVFHILPRPEQGAAGLWGSWPVSVLSFVAIWLLSVAVAAICLGGVRLVWRPHMGQICRRCGYLLVGLPDDPA